MQKNWTPAFAGVTKEKRRRGFPFYFRHAHLRGHGERRGGELSLFFIVIPAQAGTQFSVFAAQEEKTPGPPPTDGLHPVRFKRGARG
jgi:hypothetical protein